MDRKAVSGRKAAIDHSELDSEILRHKEEVVISGKIAFPSSKVWMDISEKIKNRVSPKGIYTYVQKNRHCIWSQLGLSVVTQESMEDLHENYTENEPEEDSVDSDTSKDSEDEVFNSEAAEVLKFNIQLSSEEWVQIAPSVTSYARKEKRRDYLVLRKRTWTHVFNSRIWNASRLSCCFSFKRCKVNRDGKNYVTIYGKCTDCNSVLKGIINEKPKKNRNVSMECIVSGNFLKIHTIPKKRHLSGSVRKEAIRKMCQEKMSATLFRSIESSSCMDLEDVEPSHIPNLSVLRTAKSQALEKHRQNSDPIIAISIEKHNPPYQGVIHDIGYDRFYVHYWSTAQLHVYRAFCERESHPKVCLDATGGLVRKIKRVTGKKSKHIFLYQVVISDKNIKKQFSVSQMLSERQDTVSIQHWLNQWIQSGATSPKEAVIDMSHAMIGATIRAFTQFNNLDDYIIRCWDIVSTTNDEMQHELPSCFVRLDVAHIMKLVSRWKCLRDTRKRIKEFYMRGIAQIILSKDLETCKSLLRALLIVAFSEYDGLDPVNKEMTACEEAKQKLKELYSSSQDTRVEQFVSDMVEENNTAEMVFDEDSKTGLQFQKMASNIVDEIKSNIAPQTDGHDNLQYLPDISLPIIKLFRMLPLWSGVMLPFFKYGSVPASSAAIESDFNILKNMIFSNHTLPIRLDDFLSTHINSLDGTMKLAAVPNVQVNDTNLVNQDDIGEQNLQHDMINTQDSCDEKVASKDYGSLNATETDINVTIVQNSCPACNMGHYPDPDGGHKCIICSVPVHALQECSFPASSSDEGYGQKRICQICFKKSETEKRKIQEHNKMENWRGLAITSKKRTYFQPDPKWQNIDLSQKNERKPLGVLKNGHCPKLKVVKCGKEILTLSNTCAADSLVQLLATTIVDSESFRYFVEKERKDIVLLELAHYIATKGIGNKVYTLRAKILRDIIEPIKLPQGIFHLNCHSNIGDLATKLMKAFPCATENSVCSSQYCPKKEMTTTIPVPIIQVKTSRESGVQCVEQLINEIRRIDEISECKKTFEKMSINVPNEEYTLDTSISAFPLCSGSRTSNTKLSDNLIVVQLMFSPYEKINSVDLYPNQLAVEVLHKVPLKEIPLNINIENNEFHLRGVVGFSLLGEANTLGHYIAYALRNDGKWEAYDDLYDKVELVSSKHKVVPHIIMYSI